MKSHRLVPLAVAVTLAVSGSVVGLAPATAAQPAHHRITVQSSDYDVASGEQFVLRGRLARAGTAVEDASVRVKAFRDGRWHRLRGAVVRTDDRGRYRVRVILGQRGDRLLRVVGVPSQRGDDRARRNIVIDVH